MRNRKLALAVAFGLCSTAAIADPVSLVAGLVSTVTTIGIGQVVAFVSLGAPAVGLPTARRRLKTPR